jgi:stage II sporulation protein AA (anti-sigma F factor antagonist)
MSLDVERVGHVNVIRLSGKILTEAAQEMKTEFDSYEARARDTLVDMQNVEYMSSYLIGILVACYKRAATAGQRFELAGVSPRIRLVLTVSSLDSVLRCHATLEEGLKSLEAGRPAEISGT